jgi:endoglycosylceramidase
MTAAIRSVDREHLVFSEPWVLFNFGQSDTSISGIGAPEAGLSFHVYALNADDDARVMDRAIAASARGDALLASEFGATTDTATLRRQTGQLDSHLLPWIFWSYDENMVHDLTRPPGGDNVQASTLDALVRPNPMVTNGTPTGSTFDPATRVFDYTYRTTHPDGTPARAKYRTSILLPSRVYPAGYTVTVDGAAVHRCTTTLTLHNDPHAVDVHVHVTPGGPCGRPRVP